MLYPCSVIVTSKENSQQNTRKRKSRLKNHILPSRTTVNIADHLKVEDTHVQ